LSEPWLLNFGVAYDSEFQDSSEVSPLLPVNSAWRFEVGAQQQLSRTSYWGIATEYLYGGSLDTELQGVRPPALGGRGDVVGSYDNTSTFRPPDVWDFVMILAARAGRLRSVQSSLRVREDGENQTLRALSRQFFLIPSEPPGTR
jgi:hypothetical protein